MYETLLYFFLNFTCMRGDTEKLEAQVSLYRSPDINKSS